MDFRDALSPRRKVWDKGRRTGDDGQGTTETGSRTPEGSDRANVLICPPGRMPARPEAQIPRLPGRDGYFRPALDPGR